MDLEVLNIAFFKIQVIDIKMELVICVAAYFALIMIIRAVLARISYRNDKRDRHV